MHIHFRKVCDSCNAVIEQCRCASEKYVIHTICDKCKELSATDMKENTQDKKYQSIGHEAKLEVKETK